MSWSRKVIKNSCKAALLGSAFLLSSALPASAISLTEAMQLAISTNPDIGIVASNREAVDQELRQARGLYLPQIDLLAGAGYEWRNDFTSRARGDSGDGEFQDHVRKEAQLTLQQRLFDGFEAGATVAREKARVESAANRVLENSEVLALDAIGAYYEVLRGRELVRLAEENLRVHLDIVESLKARLSGGGGSRADVAQAETRTARAKTTLTDNYNNLRDAEASYTRIVGQFPDQLDPPEAPSGALPADIETAVDLAGKNNLTTRIFEADVRTAQAEVELAEVPLWPSLTLEGLSEYNQGTTGQETYEFNHQIMVRLRWNLFRGGIDRAARQEALHRVNENKNRRYRAFLESQEEMRQSWFALEASRQSVMDLQSAVQFSQETLGAYQQQFEVAQRTLLDVLDAENELFVTSGELVTAQTNEALATFRILAVGGTLMSTMGVTPPEQSRVQHKSWFDGLAD